MFKFLVVLLIVVIIVAGPLAVIWAWNTLFGAALMIEYTFWSWLAVIVMGCFISPSAGINAKS
jgi:hypothetical protein